MILTKQKKINHIQGSIFHRIFADEAILKINVKHKNSFQCTYISGYSVNY